MPYDAALLVGPTGSGKTPLGEMLQRRGLLGRPCAHFDFGEQLRKIVHRGAPDANVTSADIDFLRGVLERGVLLEDDHFPIAARVLQSYLESLNTSRPNRLIVMNGLPRHAGQAVGIAPWVRIVALIWLDCTPEVVRQRIARDTGGDRRGRADDDLDAIRRKLQIYATRTEPLLNHYRNQRAVEFRIRVTAEMTPEEMWQNLHPRPPAP